MILDLTHILIFRTSIYTFPDKLLVQKLFEASVAVDDRNHHLEDVDCVLRVVSRQVGSMEIISQLNALGFECSELD